MKRFLLLFLPIAILFLNGCYTQSKKTKELISLDNTSKVRPKEALDSLLDMDPSRLSMANRAHYYLILTSIHEGSLRPIKDDYDSLINISYNWYKSQGDNYNTARSALYWGINRYRVAPADSLCYSLLKESESLFSNLEGEENDSHMALTRVYLANYLTKAKRFEAAENYYLSAAPYFKKNHHFSRYIKTKLDYSKSLYLNNEKERAFRVIDSLETDKTLPLLTRYGAYSTIATFYANLREYSKAIDYLQKKLTLIDTLGKANDLKSINIALIRYSSLIGDKELLDEKAQELDSIINSSQKRMNYVHLNRLSEAYENVKDFEKSFYYKDKAYENLISIKNQESIELKRLHKAHDELTLRSQGQRVAILILSLLIIIVLSVLLPILIKEIRLHRREKVSLSVNRTLISEIAASQNDFITELTNSVGSISDDEVRKNLKKLINDYIKEHRQNIFIKMSASKGYPLEQEKMSEQEKFILFLSERGYDYKDITNIILSSSSSVRSSRNRIKGKLGEK